jgi:hypothetical protein
MPCMSKQSFLPSVMANEVTTRSDASEEEDEDTTCDDNPEAGGSGNNVS